MKLKAALLAVLLGLAPMSHGAVVDPAEPPATPAGGKPEAGIGVAGAVGIAIAVGVLVAVITADDDDTLTTTTTTTTTR
jgi:hypothetical protein